MTPYPIEIGPEVRYWADQIARTPLIVHFRGEPDIPKWQGRCKVHFDPMDALVRSPRCPLVREDAIRELDRDYTGPNQRLGDYYVRELARIGTEHRQVVRYLVVGTGRIEQMPRSRFDKMVRPA